MTTLATLDIRTGQTVLTYEPDGWPQGIITGNEDGRGGFHIRHVCVFPGASSTTLIRMVRLGLEEAWSRGYQYVTYCLPRDFRLAFSLAVLGQRLGFTEYARDQGFVFYVCYRKGE